MHCNAMHLHSRARTVWLSEDSSALDARISYHMIRTPRYNNFMKSTVSEQLGWVFLNKRASCFLSDQVCSGFAHMQSASSSAEPRARTQPSLVSTAAVQQQARKSWSDLRCGMIRYDIIAAALNVQDRNIHAYGRNSTKVGFTYHILLLLLSTSCSRDP